MSNQIRIPSPKELEEIVAAFRYDSDTGKIIRVVRLNNTGPTGNAESLDSKGYLRVEVRRKSYQAHRVAWLLHYGEWPTFPLDHANGNRSDNRAVNLRAATYFQNAMNSRTPKTNTSGFKGVTFHKQTRKWQAAIQVNGKCNFIGLFSTPDAAGDAYLRKAVEVAGEFATNRRAK